MPLKSKAQRRKFAELLLKGDITEEAFERWNRETGSAELPERVGDPGGRAKKTKRTKRAAKTKRSTRAKPTKRTRTKTKRTTRVKKKRAAAKRR